MGSTDFICFYDQRNLGKRNECGKSILHTFNQDLLVNCCLGICLTCAKSCDLTDCFITWFGCYGS